MCSPILVEAQVVFSSLRTCLSSKWGNATSTNVSYLFINFEEGGIIIFINLFLKLILEAILFLLFHLSFVARELNTRFCLNGCSQ